MRSSTKENYIKALYHLHLENEKISLSELSNVLDVKKSSANDMVKKLALEGFLINERYKPIQITERGKKVAANIIRKHRLSEMFLSKIMNFGWEEVHDIAEELEHIKVDKFFDRMDELLGFPSVDPHGSPIPDKNGNFIKPEYKTLSSIQAGKRVILKSLKDSSAELLLHLNKKEIQLNTEILVEQIEAFDGGYIISYNDHREVVLSQSVCEHLLVEEM